MSVAHRTTSPHRAKALGYYRDHRVQVRTAAGIADCRPDTVFAKVFPAPGDPSGYSAENDVTCVDGTWDCTCSPGANAYTHRLAVQMSTGWGHLDGGWSV